MAEANKYYLKNLFYDFLIIGSTSFGGFMALISIVEKQLVEKRRIFSSEELLDTISVASILPGPMAVNVVTALGYKLRGMKGAMISMTAILLPTYIFILVFSWLYFEYGHLPQVDSAFQGILPAVCAIIVSVALNMARKNISDFRLAALCLLACVVFITVGGFFITLILMASGGVLGYLFFGVQDAANINMIKSAKGLLIKVKMIFRKDKIFYLMTITVFFLSFVSVYFFEVVNAESVFFRLRMLLLTFSGVSVTLFGGGYVFIPLLQDLMVQQLQWVTEKEFIDGIALGQITPGPIMISAAFIGYKQAGILGSLIATIAIFLPPGLLMIVVSSFVNSIKKSAILTAALKGIRATVIGMVFAAAWIIGKSFIFEWLPVAIFLSVFVLTVRFKINIIYLIPLSGLVGLLFME